MDEILHQPSQAEQIRDMAAPMSGAIASGLERFRSWKDQATAGGRRIINPIHFLALAAVVGVAAVVSTVYTPAYVVSVDGVALGTVADPQTFEQAVDRVESRAASILGHDYTWRRT